MFVVFAIAVLSLFAVIGGLLWFSSIFYAGSLNYHEEYLDFDFED
jgi:hypothetical protein